MTFGLRCSEPARRPHPASLPVRVPAVESLPSASFSLHLAAGPCGRLRLSSSTPIGSFHPIRFCPCWAHSAADRAVRPTWYNVIMPSFRVETPHRGYEAMVERGILTRTAEYLP